MQAGKTGSALIMRTATCDQDLTGKAFACVNGHIHSMGEPSYTQSWATVRKFADTFVAGFDFATAMNLSRRYNTIDPEVHGQTRVIQPLLAIAMTRACFDECEAAPPEDDPLAIVMLAMRHWQGTCLHDPGWMGGLLCSLVRAMAASFTDGMCPCRAALVGASAGQVTWRTNDQVTVRAGVNQVCAKRLIVDWADHVPPWFGEGELEAGLSKKQIAPTDWHVARTFDQKDAICRFFQHVCLNVCLRVFVLILTSAWVCSQMS